MGDVKRKEAEKRRSAGQKSRPRSQSPSRRSRRSSRSPSDDASVSSNRSSRSNRSTRSTASHRSSSSRHSKRRPSSHGDENVSDDDDDDWEGYTKETAPGEKKEKKGLFLKIKRFAGGVKKSLGLQGVHKFKLGEK